MRTPDLPKRPRREQEFFADPAIDRLMGTVMALAQEHYVLLDRVRVLEAALEKRGVVEGASLTAPRDPADDAAAQAQAERFAAAVLRPLLGLQDARGVTGKPRVRRRARASRGA
jgi:hypothetical protein